MLLFRPKKQNPVTDNCGQDDYQIDKDEEVDQPGDEGPAG